MESDSELARQLVPRTRGDRPPHAGGVLPNDEVPPHTRDRPAVVEGEKWISKVPPHTRG